jgi:hypothetical protein
MVKVVVEAFQALQCYIPRGGRGGIGVLKLLLPRRLQG